MKFGLNQEQYKYILETVVKPLQNKGASVWCYGSRARGDHSKFSDLDLMVELKSESDMDLSSLLGNIKEILEESNFPYKVDLVEFKNFAKSYIEGYQKDKVIFD